MVVNCKQLFGLVLLAFTLSANVDAQGHQGFLRHFRKHKSAPVPPPIDWTNPKIANYNGLGRQWDPMVVWPGGFVSNLYVNVGNSYAAGYNCTGSYLYYGNMGGTEPAQTDLCIKNTLALTERMPKAAVTINPEFMSPRINLVRAHQLSMMALVCSCSNRGTFFRLIRAFCRMIGVMTPIRLASAPTLTNRLLPKLNHFTMPIAASLCACKPTLAVPRT
jgi:hypothetical protein